MLDRAKLGARDWPGCRRVRNITPCEFDHVPEGAANPPAPRLPPPSPPPPAPAPSNSPPRTRPRSSPA
ncbi:MAG: hypothetical protein F4107_00985, partial [Gemmatimonadetes bacterium]|nr:hypothetical protein [Gemmatimonadota bacterium]